MEVRILVDIGRSIYERMFKVEKARGDLTVRGENNVQSFAMNAALLERLVTNFQSDENDLCRTVYCFIAIKLVCLRWLSNFLKNYTVL